MTWREQLRKAAFRGAEFLVDSAELDTGRQSVRHEYPQRDDPYVEDMRRKTREFTVEGFVVGREYMAARDKLIEACEQAGPGTLVHPYRGELQVVCTGCRVRESTREGGLASFSLSFSDAGEARYPSPGQDTAARVDAAADKAAAGNSIGLARRLDISGPGWIGDAARGQVGGLSDYLRNPMGQLPASAASPSWASVSRGMSGGLASASASLSETEQIMGGYGTLQGYMPPSRGGMQQLAGLLSADAGSLVGSGGALAGRVSALFRGAGLLTRSSSSVAPVRSLDPLLGAARYGGTLQAVPLTTASRRRQAANQQAVAGFVERSAVIEAARASSTLDYASADDAIATREAVVSAIEGQMAVAGDDRVYTALADLRTGVVKDLGQRGAGLARLTTWRPPASLPALVAAHRLYGDAGRDAEIVTRNHIRHPGRVPGGVPLEVLYA